MHAAPTLRHALVVGSECAAMATLGFVEEVARDVHVALTGPATGGWATTPAVPGPLIDPTAEELRRALRDAFEAAHRAEAALLFWWLGHGEATGDSDMYLLCRDTAPPFDSTSAVNIVQLIREAVGNHPRVDGLAVVLDTCYAGEFVRGAGARIVDRIMDVRSRVQVLTASTDKVAYDGCMSQSLRTAIPPHPWAPFVTCEDLMEETHRRCPRQEPAFLTADARRRRGGSDGFLWLTRAQGSRPDALSGTLEGARFPLNAGAALLPPTRDAIAAVMAEDGRPLRWLSGPTGSGKSTVLAALYRGVGDADLVPPGYLVALLRPARMTPVELVASLAGQLGSEAPPAGSGSEPLVALLDAYAQATGRPVRIAIDDVGRASPEVEGLLLQSLSLLLQRTNVQFIVASWGPPPLAFERYTALLQLPFGPRRKSRPRARAGIRAEAADLARLLALTTLPAADRAARAELRHELIRLVEAAGLDLPPRVADSVAALLAVADPDTALPSDLALAALRKAERPVGRAQLHDVLARLGPVVSLVDPGTETEAFGARYPHTAAVLLEAVAAGEGTGLPGRLHAALADLLAGDPDRIPPGWREYRRAAVSSHLVQAGRFAEGRAASWANRDRTGGRPRRGPM